MTEDLTYFAKTNFREKEYVFGIKKDDRRRHAYIIGKTGMGKTNLLETMIISDIKAGNGIAIVDPHGDLAEKILNFIPASRINDVVYFNPADADHPIAFNVMEQVDPKYRHLVASGLIGVFKKIWADSWGPRLEYLLRNVILALLEYPGSTLLGVPRMFIDKDYRKKVVNKVSDPVVKAFWLNEFTKYSSQFTVDAISPIQNKVGQFLSSSLVRNIIAQTHSTIDMREIMDNKKILVINLAKGKIGEDYSALLGAMLITKIQLAAMGRSDIPEEERKDFYLYVDEFQNFATESFAGILSEARKYRLNLIIAHQYIGQLEEEVRDSVFGNVGTIITFRVGAADAEFLEKEFEPVFMMNDIVNLTKYDIYLKLMIDGVTGDAFSATTLPPSEVTEQSNIEKIIRVSRERYANKREVVEEKISRWSGMGDEDKKMENNDNKKGNEFREIESKNNISKNEEKEMWDAVCEICGEKIKVPFKPDPKRSTYCKNCLVEVRKQVVESVQNNKTGNTDFKKEEKKEICQTEKAEIKTTDSKNSFVGRDVNERKEKSFSVSNNFQIQKNKEVFEKQSNAIIEDDSSKKNVSVEKINQPNHKDLPKGKPACPAGRDLEIKEGEVVKF
ncbi:MAG: type IV secretion system DNA-binding domain-containing protein [Candidatus Andersenbacteria bacterium]|nr:type IV secretion system DNA-binding domain-containing protein [Candidatus Andersenbacteria bacterium]